RADRRRLRGRRAGSQRLHPRTKRRLRADDLGLGRAARWQHATPPHRPDPPRRMIHLPHINIWVTAGITAGLLVLLTYMIRVPHDYPLRGMVVAVSALAFAGSGAVLGLQIWHRASRTVPTTVADVKTSIKAATEHELETQPVGALDSYVPIMPG